MNKIFCPHAYNALEVRTGGDFRPCCISEKKFCDSNGIPFDAGTSSISDVYNSSDRKNWQENFDLYFEKDCKQCAEVEKSGGESKRLREIKYWNVYYNGDVPKFDSNSKLELLDLKLGNTCNLACATCSGKSSSKWNSIYHKLKGGWELPVQKWQDTDNFWESINEISSDLKKVEIAGGEPFMIKKQRIFLNYLVDKNLAKNIDITWITNSTYYEEDIINLFPHFKQVRVMVSIDNTHDKFEYMRWPAKWNDSYEIFKKFNNLKQQGLIDLGISHTISAINILDLPDMWKFARDHKVNIFNNLVMWPFHCKNLPHEFKLKVKERIEQVTDNSYQTNPAGGHSSWLVDFMMQEPDGEDLTNAWKKQLSYVNHTRPGQFERAFTELAEYIKVEEFVK